MRKLIKRFYTFNFYTFDFYTLQSVRVKQRYLSSLPKLSISLLFLKNVELLKIKSFLYERKILREHAIILTSVSNYHQEEGTILVLLFFKISFLWRLSIWSLERGFSWGKIQSLGNCSYFLRWHFEEQVFVTIVDHAKYKI